MMIFIYAFLVVHGRVAHAFQRTSVDSNLDLLREIKGVVDLRTFQCRLDARQFRFSRILIFCLGVDPIRGLENA